MITAASDYLQCGFKIVNLVSASCVKIKLSDLRFSIVESINYKNLRILSPTDKATLQLRLMNQISIYHYNIEPTD